VTTCEHSSFRLAAAAICDKILGRTAEPLLNHRSLLSPSQSLPLRGLAAAHQLDFHWRGTLTPCAPYEDRCPRHARKSRRHRLQGSRICRLLRLCPERPSRDPAKTDSLPPRVTSPMQSSKKVARNHRSGHILGHKYIVCPGLTTPSGNLPTATNRLSISSTKPAKPAARRDPVRLPTITSGSFSPTRASATSALRLPARIHRSANLKMELDLCWITVAGKDPSPISRNIPAGSRWST